MISPTIWKKLDDGKIKLNEEKLLDLFAASAPATGKSTSHSQAPPIVPKTIELVDSNKGRSIAILLSRIKMSYKDIAMHIKQIDVNSFSEDQIQSMINNLPTTDEIAAVKGFDGEKSQLGVCEQFFTELITVDDLPIHFDLLMLLKTFNVQIEDIVPPLETMSTALDKLQTSQNLSQLLTIILKTGNYLNGGTTRGGAFGFKIETFAKLRELRSSKPGYTLLHYIVDLVHEQYPKVAGFVEELSSIKDCLRFDLDTITKQLQNLSSVVTKCQRYMPKAEGLVMKGDLFHPKFREFEDNQSSKVENAQKKVTAINKKYTELAQYYAEDPNKIKMDEFLQIFADFINDFDKARKEIQKMKEDEEKKKKLEELRKSKPSSTRHRVNPNRNSRRGVLDIMMADLEEGNTSTVKKTEPSRLQAPITSQNDLLAAMALVRKKK